jgi:hypothetical protein
VDEECSILLRYALRCPCFYDLVDFVNSELFPYLKKFKESAENANTIEYKILVYDPIILT